MPTELNRQNRTNRQQRNMASKKIAQTSKTIKLIVEGNEGALWGRLEYDGNLITEEAKTIEDLKRSIQQLMLDFHGLEPSEYRLEVEYDLTAFFNQFDFLKVTKIAEISGLNGSLVRQYATGKKHPSAKQAEKIENAVKNLARELASVQLYTR